jgi:minor extracellular serine protease Vpr
MSRGKGRFVVGVTLVAVVLVLAAAGGAGARAVSGPADESAHAWFVQLAGAPVAKGGDKAALKAARQTFFQGAADQGLDVKQRYAFETLWNGVSVDVPAAQAGGLATVPGVVAVTPVVPLSLASDDPTAEGVLPSGGDNSDPELSHSLGLVGADIAHARGFTGAGVKVAVIDSGVDYRNPDLGGCAAIGPGCKVAKGWDFVGDDFDSNSDDSTYDPVAVADPDPRPCNPIEADLRAQAPGGGTSSAGHGTHVAGIVAAKAGPEQGAVTGVAPDATLYAYRVFGCNGSTSSDIMIAAMERAYSDGAQVVNMSIGAALVNFPDYPTSVAADNLVDRGVVVVTSIGNSGDTGLFSASAPGVGNKVIGTASVQNTAAPFQSFDVTNGTTTLHVPYNRLNDTKIAPSSGAAGEIVYVGRGCPKGSGSAPNPPLDADDPYLADPSGKVALILRGYCSFNDKYQHAVDSGATAVVIMNDGADPTRVGMFNGGFTTDRGVVGVTTTFTDGKAIQDLAGTKSMTWTDKIVESNDPLAGQISSTSSWGLTSDLQLKPDISAPGGNIRSTWPIEQFDGHNVIGGTSMASPHVAGAAALLLAARPGMTPEQVRQALLNTGTPFASIPVAGRADSTARQGAGLLAVMNALNSSVSASPAKLALGQGHGGSRTITLTNPTTAAVTYTPSNLSTVAVDPFGGVYPFTFGTFFFSNTVTFSAPAVTVPAHGTTTIDVTIAEPGWDDRAIYGGYIRFTPAAGQGGGVSLRVPYAGFVGDLQSVQVLGSGGCNLPLLVKFGTAADKVDCEAGNLPIQGAIAQPNGGTWDQPKSDPVVLLYHFDHQAQRVKITLVDAATGTPVTQGGRNAVLFDDTIFPRSTTPMSFFGFQWDGTSAFTDNGGGGKVHRKAVPAGSYKLRLDVTHVKAFNDPRTPVTETWISPPITLRGT